MAGWQISCITILQISVTLFFVLYIVRQNSLDSEQRNNWLTQQKSQPQILTQLQQGGGCLKVLDLPLAPGIFATVFLAYVPIAMLLFTPLHPTQEDSLWQLVTSGLALLLLISPPMLVMAISEIVIVSHTQQINNRIHFIQIIIKSLLLLVGVAIVVWFGMYADS